MKRSLFILFFILSSCKEDAATSTDSGVSANSCRGVYYERDANGDLSKYNQYLQKDQGQCLTDKVSLTTYEASTEKRRKLNVKCKPQSGFPTMALKADGNYYNYRNGRYFLDFDSTTGVFRRLLIGEDANGKPLFQRDLACFSERKDTETEPVNPQNYGNQIMFDFSETPASSADFTPVEIFKYQSDSNGNWFFNRYDDVYDWTFAYCPQNKTPFYENCQEIRNGNIYFHNVLDSVTQDKLRSESILIRTQFNFTQISKSEFESLWNYHEKNTKELQLGGDWRYFPTFFVDANKFYDYDWRMYLSGVRETMPDAASIALGSQIQPICYQGSQIVTLTNGNKGRVYGEICYVNGQYSFTQQ